MQSDMKAKIDDLNLIAAFTQKIQFSFIASSKCELKVLVTTLKVRWEKEKS